MKKRELYRKIINKNEYNFNKILKDEWDLNEKTMSSKLIYLLN